MKSLNAFSAEYLWISIVRPIFTENKRKAVSKKQERKVEKSSKTSKESDHKHRPKYSSFNKLV
jgi:hypothetical protein